MSPKDRRSAATVALAAAAALMLVGPAWAQGPPAPGTPPPTSPPPSAPPAVEPEAPAEPGAPEPSPNEAPPEVPAPSDGAALTTHELVLNGRRIEVPLRCAAPGRVTLTRRGKRVGRARFACEDQLAVAEVRVRSRVARRLANKRRHHLKVVSEAAGLRHVERSILRIPRAARAAALSAPLAFCGSRYSIYNPGFSIAAPDFASDTSAGEWMWYRPWRYWHGHGWDLPDPRWQGPVWAPGRGQGATVIIGNTTIDYVDDYHGWYIAAGEEVYRESTRTSSFEWAPMQQVYFGLPVHGGWWCHPS